MPLPKRKHSKARGRKRRTHWTLTAPNVIKCPNCTGAILPHHICTHCGFYRGRKMVEIKEV